MPDELDVGRGWSDGAGGIPVDWGMQNWSEELHVRDEVETCVTDRRAAAAAAFDAQKGGSRFGSGRGGGDVERRLRPTH